MRTLVLCLALAAAAPAAAAPAKKSAPAGPIGSSKVVETPVALATADEPRKVAEAYLKALTGEGPEAGREALLGGATLTAQIFTLASWKIAARDPTKTETGELADVRANVDALDKEGRNALSKLLGGGPAADLAEGDMKLDELTAADARQLLDPTRARAQAFLQSHPVFAYVFRVDKEVYWHPQNPVRKALADAGGKGKYTLEFHRFWIETEEGLGTKTIRKWPLRVVRLRSPKGDTGFKILPASDWNAE